MIRPSMPILRTAALAVAIASLALLAGCSTEVPPAASDGAVFTLWGRLDPTAAWQAVRVEPISTTIDGGDALDATVVSVDLETGEQTAWRDSVVTFADGSVGHVFLADVTPAFGSHVEFRVLQDGEVATSARVRVPPRVVGFFTDLRIGASSTVDLVLPGAPRVVGARVAYDIRAELDDFAETVDVEDSDVTSIDFGWEVAVDFTSQVELLRSRFLQRGIRSIRAEGVRVQGFVANEEWAAPYPFEFSRNLLIQPGTVSNVQNGYGFLGAAYPFDYVWEVDDSTLRRLGL